jgi:hypothetical protein
VSGSEDSFDSFMHSFDSFIEKHGLRFEIITVVMSLMIFGVFRTKIYNLRLL